MPYIPEGCVNIQWEITLEGDPEVMLVSLGFAANDTFFDPADDDGPIAAAFADNLLPEMYEQYHLGTQRLQIGHGDDPPTIWEGDASNDGVLSGNTLPQNCALLVRKLSTAGGRANKGRLYMPGMLGEAIVNNVGTVEPSALAGLQTAFSNFGTDLLAVAGIDDLLILHSDNTLPPTVITNFQPQSRIATQRRRLRP